MIDSYLITLKTLFLPFIKSLIINLMSSAFYSQTTTPNPFGYRFKTEPNTGFSLQSNYLMGPTYSVCPKRKYSRPDPYTSKYAQSELSQKVLYKMEAEYYRLQSMSQPIINEVPVNECLLNSYCHKNPFQKKNFLSPSLSPTKQNTNILDPHWSTEESKMVLRDPNSFPSSRNLMNQYESIRKKALTFSNEAPITSETVLEKEKIAGMKVTFGEQKFVNPNKSVKRANSNQSIPSQKSESSNVSPNWAKNSSRDDLSRMVKRMSSSHDLQPSPNSINFRNKVFQAINIQ